MPMLAHKTRLHVNNVQANFLARCCGVRRFAFNWALAEWQRQYAAGEKPGAYALDKQFNTIKRDEFAWMYEVPSCVAQQAIVADLNAAMRNFFRRVKNGGPPGYPKFKRRGQDNATFTNTVVRPVHIVGDRLQLPKSMGWARLGDAPRYSGKLQKTTVSRSAGKWYVSFCYEVGDEQYTLPAAAGGPVGVDVGVCNFVVTSDGEKFAPPHAYAKYERRLLRAQRTLARMVKFSNNWRKQRQVVARLHARVAGVRRDYIQQASAALAAQHPLVALEDLQVRQMTRSARGTVEAPGVDVKNKARLNRNILDRGFYMFRQAVEHKVARRGGRVVLVPPKYTSLTCPQCGCVDGRNRPTQAQFRCIGCGHTEHADVVGARNVLALGMATTSPVT